MYIPALPPLQKLPGAKNLLLIVQKREHPAGLNLQDVLRYTAFIYVAGTACEINLALLDFHQPVFFKPAAIPLMVNAIASRSISTSA